MAPADYLALLYVDKNAEKGQSVSEIYNMFQNAKYEIIRLSKESENKEKPRANVRVVK